MEKRIFLIVGVVLAGVARAETFTVPLDANGPYTIYQEVPFDFDLGVGSCNIQTVRFACEGTRTAGVDYFGWPFSWEFEAWFRAEPGYQVADGSAAGAATYPTAEPFEGESGFHRVMKGTWDFLLDGQASGW
ncbi:MAG: hypothetical protein ACYS21_17935, partial [Planctomycetota bacterium]